MLLDPGLELRRGLPVVPQPLLGAHLEQGEAAALGLLVGGELHVLAEELLHLGADLDLVFFFLLGLRDSKALGLGLGAAKVLGVDGVDDVEDELPARAHRVVGKVPHVDVVVLDLLGDLLQGDVPPVPDLDGPNLVLGEGLLGALQELAHELQGALVLDRHVQLRYKKEVVR